MVELFKISKFVSNASNSDSLVGVSFESNKKIRSMRIWSALKVDFTDKISNQLLKDIDTLASLKRYISEH